MRYFFLTYYHQPDGKFTESGQIAKTIKTNDFQKHNVIMDFREKKILKCHVDKTTVDKNWDNIYNYYERYYRDVFDQLTKFNERNNEKT